ncbi:MAG TPA: hypothetical protein VN429_10490 [Methanospirillum sp.]|uniref:hypothetical protein n=1 Tax=Methanospirillum sp. TaxID=45200 RepID=UPI002C9AB8C1|nr:hypothetical protein [Methanospirillum sp.]HWQ64833.1 hypothetical protein [Methanospirillum sp.]
MKARLHLPTNSSLYGMYNGKTGLVTFLPSGRAKVVVELEGHTDMDPSTAILYVPVNHIEVVTK